jgi:hypothetical protein
MSPAVLGTRAHTAAGGGWCAERRRGCCGGVRKQSVGTSVITCVAGWAGVMHARTCRAYLQQPGSRAAACWLFHCLHEAYPLSPPGAVAMRAKASTLGYMGYKGARSCLHAEWCCVPGTVSCERTRPCKCCGVICGRRRCCEPHNPVCLSTLRVSFLHAVAGISAA